MPSATAGANFPSVVVSQTNILNEACVFGNVTQSYLQETRVAVHTTIHVAEERHQAFVYASNQAHQQEMESLRREARAAHEARDYAEVVRSTRLRALELAF